jgi:small neutral amino acid transporter SnatA (MarC family)
MIGPGEIFTLFFVTLGPEKVIGPFAQQTRALEPAALRGVALRVFVLSLFAVGVGGFFGRHLVHRWHISMPALLISTGSSFSSSRCGSCSRSTSRRAMQPAAAAGRADGGGAEAHLSDGRHALRHRRADRAARGDRRHGP